MVFLCSCGSSEPSSESESNETANAEDGTSPDVLSLIENAGSGIPEDLESFLNDGDSKQTTVDDAISHSTESESVEQLLAGTNEVVDNNVSDVTSTGTSISLEAYEAEKALSNLEEGAISHQRSIDELRRINSRKDRTIASLTKLNKELVSEVNRLKGGDDIVEPVVVKSDGTAMSSNTKLMGLKSEVKNLRGNLLIKSQEIQDLRIRNDSLEERISLLELNPAKSRRAKALTFTNPKYSSQLETPSTKDPVIAPKVKDLVSAVEITEAPFFVGGCSLQFDAVVTALNGKNKEAFYTEFFVVNEDVEKVLRTGGIKLEEYAGIDSYAELWARSRKNSFLFPNVQKNIRALLLKIVEAGKGYRVRTDINGSATLENLPAGKFFVVGTASLGKIGVTWSVPIQLKTGMNKLSLTLANADWSL